MITTTYRDIEITYDEHNEKWTCEMQGSRRSRQNLKDCRAAIDKFYEGEKKVKEKFERFDVIRYKWSRWENATVTSISDQQEVWIVDEEGNREKINSYECRNVYLKTEENLATIEKIKQNEKRADDIDKETEKLKATLTSLNPQTALK